MKKLSLIMMLVLVVVLMATTETMSVKAVDETVYYTPQNARFQFSTNSAGEDNYLWVQFDTLREYYQTPNRREAFTDLIGSSDYDLRVKQYDDQGNYIQEAFVDVFFRFERGETVLEVDHYGICDYNGGTRAESIHFADGSLGEIGEIIRVYNVTQNVEINRYDPSVSAPTYTVGGLENINNVSENDEAIIRLSGLASSPSSCVQGDTIQITYELIQGQQWYYDRTISFSNLDFDETENGIYFYKIFLNNKVVNSGAFMDRPQEDIDFSGNEGIEIGKYYSEGYKSSYELEDYTYFRKDDYFILNYELSNLYTYGGQGREIDIIFTDIETNTLEFSFDTTDLLQYQNWANMYATGQLTDNVRNSFIIMPTSNSSDVLKTLETDFEVLNDRTIVGDFDYGVYMPTLYDFDTTTVVDHNTTLIIKSRNPYFVPYALILESYDLEIEEMQRVTFSKRDTNVTSSYTTILAKDNVLNYDYSAFVNDSGTISFNTRYRTTDYVGSVGVQWILEPVSMPYGLDPEDYRIELTQVYETVDTSSTEKTVDEILAYYGVEGDPERFLVYLGVMILFNIITLFVAYAIGNLLVPIVVVNIFLLFIGSYLGLLPMWAIIGSVLVLLLMIITLLNNGGGGEE